MDSKQRLYHSRATPELAAILARGREDLNAIFARTRLRYPRLDSGEFSVHFMNLAGELLSGVPDEQEISPPDRVERLVHALFEHTALLCAKNFLGSGARLPDFPRLWRLVLAGTPELALNAPRRHLASTANALTRLLRNPEVDTAAFCEDWIAFARSSGADAGDSRGCDARQFEQAGCVIAWRHGMARLRSAALDAARELAAVNARAARLALGLPGKSIAAQPEANPNRIPAGHEQTTEPGSPLGHLIEGLAANPWRTPADLDYGLRSETPVLRRVGAFAGFGGEFLRPPKIHPGGDRAVLDDGEELYALYIDVFGHAFRRIRPGEFAQSEAQRQAPDANGGPSLEDGVIVVPRDAGELRFEAPQLKQVASWTAVGNHSLVATLPDSHMVYVIGFPFTQGEKQ